MRLLFFTFVFHFLATFQVQAAKLEEHHLKAAFLYNFSHFISWPQFGDERPAFRYCVMGSGPVENTLHELIRGQPENEWNFVYQQVTDLQQLQDCHLLFISKYQQQQRIDNIIRKVGNRSVLTVSDSKDFAIDGGMIELVRKNNHIRVIINNDEMVNHGLKVSSKLLRFVTVVSTKPGRGNHNALLQ